MLKSPYAKYILVPILIIVWGLIFYRIYQAVWGGENYDLPETPSFIMLADSAVQEEEYALLLDYRDPFLGKKFRASYTPRSGNYGGGNRPPASYNRPNSNSNNNRPRTNPGKKPAAENATPNKQPLPKIIYQGFVASNQDTSAAIKIDGRYYPSVKVGQQRQGVLVRGIYKDSLRVVVQGEGLTVLK